MRGLALDGAEGDEADLLLLASFRRFTGLRELKIVGCEADDEVPAYLARVGHWRHLEALSMEYNQLGVGGCLDLIDAPRLVGLRTLLLSNNELGDDDVRELLQRPELARLTGFGIGGDYTHSATTRAVAECPYLVNLRLLVLSEAGVDATGAHALAVSPHLGGVMELDVSRNPIHGARGVAHLLGGPNFQRLTELNLGLSELGPIGARRLAGWAPLANLEALKLNGAELGDEGLEELLKAPSVRRLRHLDLFHNSLSDRGVIALAGCEKIGRLRELVLGGNDWSVAGAEALARSPHLTRLRRLVLSRGGSDEAEQARKVLVERYGARVRYW